MTVTTIAPAALVEGAPRTPLPYGLFSVVSPRGEGDGRWQNGVQWEPGTCDPADGIGQPDCDDQTPTIGLPKNLLSNLSDTGGATPFTVYGHFQCSPVGNPPAVAQQRANDHLVNREEARVERAFWTGDLGNVPNLAVNDGTATPLPVTLGTGSVRIEVALGLLEDWLGTVYGSLGVIHMTRGLALQALSQKVLESRGGRLYTLLGTPVVAGAGYPGTGPNNVAAAAGTSWIYATPALFGYRGDVFTSSNRPGDLFDRARNDLYAVAEREYLLGFDPCGVAAVQVKSLVTTTGTQEQPLPDEPGTDLAITLGSIPSSPIPDGTDTTIIAQTNVTPTDEVFLWYSVNGDPPVLAGEMTQVDTHEFVWNVQGDATGPGDSVEVWAVSAWDGADVESNHITIEVLAADTDMVVADVDASVVIPDESWTHAQIDAWAADPDHTVDLSRFTTKAEKVAAINAAISTPAPPEETP